MHQLLIALLVQNKVGHPAPRSFGIPCAARQAGRRPNSRYALRQRPPTAPVLAVLLGVVQGEWGG